MNPVISVIVPVYNAKKYLRECIDSVITQYSFERTELILVDDGSTDVSSAICSMYAERFENVKYIRQENSGVSAARNAGIKAAEGDYIQFADADDLLMGGTLKKIIETIEKENPDMIFFDYKYEYSDSYVQISFPFKKNCVLDSHTVKSEIAGFMLSDSSFNAVWNKAFRKEIIDRENISFTAGKKYGEDKDFVLSFMEKCRSAYYLAETCYFYRYVESGAIQKARTDYFSDIIDDFRYTLEKYRSFDVDEKETEEKSRKFLALKIISCVEMAHKRCSGKVFCEIISAAAKDSELCSAVKELVDGGYFANSEYRKIAEKLLNGKGASILRSYKKDDIKNSIYKRLGRVSEKEPFVCAHDNEEILKYPFKVTVFTPVYNRRRTINRVFDSLVRQTYKDFEWLIVDDGSTDNLKELIDEYKEKSDFLIRYYYKPNGGKHTAINWAYNLTDSEYFITVDSDDAMLPQTIERFLELWKKIPQEKRGEYWSVVGRCRNGRTGEMKGGLYPEGINELENPEAEAEKVDGDKFSCPRTEILKKYPFPEPEGTTFITECVVWNKINSDYKQYYTNEVLHDCYSEEEDSLSTAWFKNHIEQGYISNYFWMCSMLNESYNENKMKIALKVGYYGYVSGKSLKTIRNDINSHFYKAVCTAEFPFLFIVKKLRYSKYTDN